MSEDINPPVARIPDPGIRRRRFSVNLIWLVPIAAAIVGISMVVRTWSARGPTIAISFETAEGLEAGKTQVKYKDVVIGSVKAITLAEDRSHVVVEVGLDHEARTFATADSRFWVVRPRIGATGISGIGTLFSGAYIAADTSGLKETKRTFAGLERPPAVINGAPGKRFVLRATQIGSLDAGSPVYYRRIEVGRVISYKLDPENVQVIVEIFVDAPYDRLVSTSSRFWNASGVDLTLDSSGLKLNTQALATVVAGGIAFQSGPGAPREEASASENAEFVLFDDFESAIAPPNGESTYLRMRFDQSLRGLAVGAPVDFHGVIIGKVVSIDLDYDADKQSFPLIVDAVIYPLRLGRAHEKIAQQMPADSAETRLVRLMKPLVARGLRAQPRTGSLLTGQLYIALDFFPNASRVTFDEAERPIDLPTTIGSFDRLQEQLAGVVEKIDKIPFESIGTHLDSALAELDVTLAHVDGELLPQLHSTLSSADGAFSAVPPVIAADSPLIENTEQTLAEVRRMALSMRELSETLERRPEALIRGVPADSQPSSEKGKGHD